MYVVANDSSLWKYVDSQLKLSLFSREEGAMYVVELSIVLLSILLSPACIIINLKPGVCQLGKILSGNEKNNKSTLQIFWDRLV